MKSNNKKAAEGKLTPNDMLSGSQIATVMGLNPYQGPNEPLKLAFDAVHGIKPKEIDFEGFHWGNTMEVPIIEEACKRLALEDVKTTFNKAFFNDYAPFAVSLDATVQGDGRIVNSNADLGIQTDGPVALTGLGIIEAKLTSHEKEVDLPEYRGKVQLQAQMDTLGASWGAVCVLYKGIYLKIFVYARDETMIDAIRSTARDFDRRVKKYKENEETDWFDFTQTKEAIAVFNQAELNTVNIKELEEEVQVINELNEEIRERKKQLEMHSALVMGKMGAHQHLVAGRFNVTWGEINYKATMEKIIPAKAARTIRLKTLKVRENHG